MNQNDTSKASRGPTVSRTPEVYQYISQYGYNQTQAQKDLLQEIQGEKYGMMAGAPDEAEFLAMQLKLMNAKKVIEVGVFRGSTTLAMALALPDDGKIVGLDISEEFTATAKKYFKSCNVEHKIELIIGNAVESMDTLINNGEAGTYDLVFIDADKVNYGHYYEKG